MSVVTTDPGAWASSASTPENWLGAWKTSADPAYFRGPDGRIMGANASFARKFGRDVTALTGNQARTLVYPEDLPIFEKAVEALAAQPHTHASEQRWLTPQGVRWLTWQEAALKDPTGKIIGYRAIGR